MLFSIAAHDHFAAGRTTESRLRASPAFTAIPSKLIYRNRPFSDPTGCSGACPHGTRTHGRHVRRSAPCVMPSHASPRLLRSAEPDHFGRGRRSASRCVGGMLVEEADELGAGIGPAG